MPRVYNRAKELLATGALNLGTADLRVMLLQAGYAYDPDDSFVADTTPGTNELSVAGYGRIALSGVSVVRDDTLDRVVARATSVNFGSLTSGQTIASAVVFEFVTNDADSNLVAFYNLGAVPTADVPVVLRFGGADPGDFLRLLDS